MSLAEQENAFAFPGHLSLEPHDVGRDADKDRERADDEEAKAGLGVQGLRPVDSPSVSLKRDKTGRKDQSQGSEAENGVHNFVPPPMRSHVPVGPDLEHPNHGPTYPHEGAVNVVLDGPAMNFDHVLAGSVRAIFLGELVRVLVVETQIVGILPGRVELHFLVQFDDVGVCDVAVQGPRRDELNHVVAALVNRSGVARLHFLVQDWRFFPPAEVGCGVTGACSVVGRENNHLCVDHVVTPAPASVRIFRKRHIHYHEIQARIVPDKERPLVVQNRLAARRDFEGRARAVGLQRLCELVLVFSMVCDGLGSGLPGRDEDQICVELNDIAVGNSAVKWPPCCKLHLRVR